MKFTGEDDRILNGVVDTTLARFAATYDQPQVRTVLSIVRANYDAGRLQKLIERQTCADVEAYIDRVSSFFGKWNDYVDGIQIQQDHQLWEELFEKLQKWAFGFLTRKRVPYSRRFQLAVDCAADAGATIATTRYPYDVDFEAWSYVLLRNVSFRQIDRLWNGKSINGSNVIDADRWDGWLESIADPAATNQLTSIDLRQILANGIDSLPDGQKEAVVLLCIQDKSYDEACALTGRSKSALYKAAHLARENLRNYLHNNAVSIEYN